uniref:Uncharacterized protein n=1 Tax=Arundo donax TaxID=35708 RepID=A0A0A8YET5_ARUDO
MSEIRNQCAHPIPNHCDL